MPHPTSLRSGDPRRVGRYLLTGRLEGIPSDDPIFIGAAPDGTDVAITVLSGDWALNAAARDRFAAEAAVAKRVPPFCAARVLDAGLDGPQAYLVSEYVPGQSLLEQVSSDGVRRGHDLEAVAVGMATGLASVHQAGLVHGNFGPEFVIMTTDGSPRVVEFGITPPYGAATPSADMLAWAQTVVFAASGHPPVTVDDLDVLPEQLRGPVERCLDSEPVGRPAARAVVQSLLGSENLPAGVLAEGSRRSARYARGGYDYYSDRPRQADHGVASHGAVSHGAAGYGAASHGTVSHGAASARPQMRARARRTADDGDGRRASRHAGTGAPVRHSRQGPRRKGWIIGGAVVVVLIVVGVFVLHTLLQGGRASTSKLSANTGVTSKTAAPGTSAPASPSQQPVAPAAFNGAWSGIVTQPPTDTYNVSVTFATGTSAGTISYAGPGIRCSGSLTLTSAAARKLTLRQGIIQGQSKCGNGQVTITLTAVNKIWFSFRSNGPIASGTLVRK